MTYTPPPASAVRAEGAWLVKKIWARTLSGRDMNERPFVPYADGRSETVDLFESGDMLGNLQVTSATSRRIAIGFTRAKEALKGAAHHFGAKGRQGRDRGTGRFKPRGKGLPARPWLGVSKAWVDAVAARLVKLTKIG